jgi:hypothetical protein
MDVFVFRERLYGLLGFSYLFHPLVLDILVSYY